MYNEQEVYKRHSAFFITFEEHFKHVVELTDSLNIGAMQKMVTWVIVGYMAEQAINNQTSFTPKMVDVVAVLVQNKIDFTTNWLSYGNLKPVVDKLLPILYELRAQAFPD